MTVSSRHKATPARRGSGKSTVIDLRALRHPEKKSKVSRHALVQNANLMVSSSAELLSIRQHLCFKSTIAVTDLVSIERRYSSQFADRLMGNIRDLLDREFGHLRVHRQRRLFVVSHHCVESLIAGLLRVQFHGQQIPLPRARDGDAVSDACGVPLSWGVGESFGEAERERVQKSKS